MKFRPSAFKWGYDEQQIVEVIGDFFGKSFEMDTPSQNGYDREMFIGKTVDDVGPLEVGVEYCLDDTYVFHCKRATRSNIQKAGYED